MDLRSRLEALSAFRGKPPAIRGLLSYLDKRLGIVLSVHLTLTGGDMPSKLGQLLRAARRSKGIGLRELARRIEKSPAFLVSLELAEEQPGVSEDTLVAISAELGLNLDQVLALAQKLPQTRGPLSATQVALYRLIKEMPAAEQEDLKRELENAAVTKKHRAMGGSKRTGGKS